MVKRYFEEVLSWDFQSYYTIDKFVFDSVNPHTPMVKGFLVFFGGGGLGAGGNLTRIHRYTFFWL